jgi:hypothetical protein
VVQLVEASCYKRVQFPMLSLELFIDTILPSLGSSQPLTKMGVKGGWWTGLTTLPPSCAICLEIWEPQTPGTLRASLGIYRDCFTLLLDL